MSSTPYAAPLRLEVRFSRWLAALVIGAHLGGAALLPLAGLPAALQIALALAVLLSLRLTWLRHLARTPTLIWEADGRWLWQEAGRERQLELLPGAYLSPWLVTLLFKETKRGRRHSLIVLPDSLDAESFRRLRVRLKLDAGSAQPR